MNDSNDKLVQITPAELDPLLSRVLAEGRSSLVLIGPDMHFGLSPEGWPKALRGFGDIFQLTDYVYNLAQKLTVECPASFEDISVLELLDGLRLEHLPHWADEQSDSLSEPNKLQTITIFLASSEELREDRDAFVLYFREQNDLLREKGVYLQIVRWENFLDAMAEKRLQDEYNQAVRDSDIFVGLFKTKTGKYTEEEFDSALPAFNKNAHKKPLIYAYFKNATITTSEVIRADFESLWRFQDKLKDLGHYPTQYENTEDLKLQFRGQLEKLIAEGPKGRLYH
ncbi:MAG: hypothetical protein ACC707_16325 [Thiohalomonadales bacterium]